MLVAGQSATINITIRRGLRVQVRLNDPSKLLLTPGDRATTSFVTVGVRSADGQMHPAELRSWDGGGQDYWVLVPAGQVVQVSLNASNHSFQDANGATVASGGAAAGAQPIVGAAGGVQQVQFLVKAKTP